MDRIRTSSCEGVRETIEHFIVECVRYEEERDRMIGSTVAVIGVEEWNRRRRRRIEKS